MSVLTIIVILLVVGLIAAPWPGFHPYGYGPSGLVGLVIVVLLILVLTGHL